MNKTIKELADALGVSKTAVRKYMTPEFRSEHVKTTENGVITIDSDGCKLVAMHLQRTEKLTETTANQFPETPEFRSEHVKTTENGVITIDSDGCKLVAMHLQRTEKLTETTANQFPETPENTANQFPETPETTATETTANQFPETPENTANQFPETPETTATVLISMLQSELDHKNEQLQVKDQQIAELNARLAEALVLAQQTAQAAQALHAGTIQQQLTDGDAGDAAPDMKAQQPHWWQRIFGK